MNNLSDSPVFDFVYKIVKYFKWYVIFLLFSSIFGSIEVSIRSYLTKCIIDSIDQNLTTILGINKNVIFYIFLTVLVIIFNNINEYVWVKLFPYIKKEIVNTLFFRASTNSYSFYQNHLAGSLSSMINNCTYAVPSIIRIFIDNLFGPTSALAISVCTLYYVDLKFSIALLLWAILYLASAFSISPTIKRLSKNVSQEASRGYIVDILSNIVSVKLFSNTQREVKLVKDNLDRWGKKAYERDLLIVKLFSFHSIFFLLFQLICFYWLFVGFDLHKYTLGDFVLVFSVSFGIYRNLTGIARNISDFSESIGILSQSLATLFKPTEIIEAPDAVSLKVTHGEIIFDNVDFNYKEGTLLFQKQSVRIMPSQKVGLVGYSGSGKTTFVNLILRLYDVTSGSILIDNQDIRSVTQDSLHKSIAMIPQELSLFHRSLIDNILYARTDASNEEVIAASKSAYAHEFIEKLPQGYESLVGERGIKLSGGQRQRIAIARAILKDAPILILDEATSQLDSITESIIQESLWKLIKNKTTLIIAHRLSTLMHVDRILVFDKGKIVEDGNHQQLISQDGLYKKLWDNQAKEPPKNYDLLDGLI